jgi:hypothetical protein
VRLADVNDNMGKRAGAAGTMPVFFVRLRYHGVPDLDPLRIGTPSLHPAFTLDDDQQLAPSVGMPVIPNACLEPNNRRGRRGQRP